MTLSKIGKTQEIDRTELDFDIHCPHCAYYNTIEIDKKEWFEAGEERTSDEIECSNSECEELFPVEYDIESYTEWYPIGFRVGKYEE